MPLSGTFSCMSLPDLLQWLGHAQKTSTLEVERDKVVRRIFFRDGRVVACCSDEPAQRLGQYLVSRGKLSEALLREALARHEATRMHLGQVLVDMGIVSLEELHQLLAGQAEETIFSIFDWDDAAFRVRDGVAAQGLVFPLDLRVDEILLQGAQRYDEMRRIRELFPDGGIVLQSTGKRPPSDLLRNRMARRVYELVDGERSLAEIVLQAHASEYHVFRLLFELFRAGLVKIGGVVRVEEELDLPPDELPREEQPAAPIGAPPRVAQAASGRAVATLVATRDSVTIETELLAARRLMDSDEYEAAIDVLDVLYQAEPNHESLRRLRAEAEAAFVEKAYRHYLPARKLPVLARSMDELTREQITPTEFFLLSRMDGTWSVKSIVQVSPIREVDALRAMKRMREKGLITLRDPE